MTCPNCRREIRPGQATDESRWPTDMTYVGSHISDYGRGGTWPKVPVHKVC